MLSALPVWASPDFERQFKLSVDASDAGPRAMLQPANDGGVLHLVSYFSKKFSSC